MSLGDKKEFVRNLLECLFPAPVASMIVLFTFADEVESLHFCKEFPAWMKKVRSYRGRKRDDKIVSAILSIEHIREWIETDKIGKIISHTKATDITPQLLIAYYGFCRNTPEECSFISDEPVNNFVTDVDGSSKGRASGQIVHMREIRDYLMDRYDPHGDVSDFIAGKKNIPGTWARGTYTSFHSKQGYGKPERRVRKAHGRNNTWSAFDD